MFNCKKLFELQIRPPSLFLLITYPRIGECFPAKSEKFDDNDNDDNNNNNNKHYLHHHRYLFMQGIYTYIPETNHVPREHRVATILM
jgi:hypothetical protein